MKKKKVDSKFPTVELDMIAFYDGHDVRFRKLVTNEIPMQLSYDIVKAINDTINDFYDKENRLNKAQSTAFDKETQDAKVPCP